ncbi:MAG: hypothetical protein FWD22_02115, partial [Treponema sp.]|nr:hypothetical protein [Treponema sp.]
MKRFNLGFLVFILLAACSNPFFPAAKEKESGCSHQYSEWATKTAATCAAEEVQEKICSLCGDIQTQEIGDPLEHTPGEAATCTDDQVCTVCDDVITDAHGHAPGDEATCEADQVCTVCDDVITDAHGHTPGDEETCNTNQVCTVCDELITPAHGVHTFDTIPATCITESIPGTCTREDCDEPNPEAVVPAGHDWNNWIQGANATLANPVGFETRTCKRGECGYSETRAFDFYYTIGDTGPGGGKIFFVADGVGFLADTITPKPLGFTLFMTADDTVGTTAYYLEASTVATLGGTGAQTTMRWSIRTTSPFPTVN